MGKLQNRWVFSHTSEAHKPYKLSCVLEYTKIQTVLQSSRVEKKKQFSNKHWHFYETSSNDSDISHINKIILFGMFQKQGQNVMLQRYHIDAYTCTCMHEQWCCYCSHQSSSSELDSSSRDSCKKMTSSKHCPFNS